jgi:PAS domain S-box-containing protein
MHSEPKANILLVDDHAENLLALQAMLENLGENLIQAQSGEEALRCLLNQDFALILLDVQMPGMNGFETATLIRSRERSRRTPIIFLTAFNTSDNLVFQGYSLGAVDYLFKPIEPDILTSKVSVFVDLFKKTEEVKRQAETLREQAIQLESINRELRQSEERFRALVEQAPDAILIADTEGMLLEVNSGACRMLGYQRDELIGTNIGNLISPEDISELTETRAILLNGNQQVREWTQIRKDGTRLPVEISTKILPDGRWQTFVRDITERKQAEAARSQVIREQIARQQAESANRMKDEFLAILSHELRTPLNSMLGWSKLLRTRSFDEATTSRALEAIERNAQSQARLIEDILDVSLIIRGKLRLNKCPINVISIIEAAIELVRPLTEAKRLNLWFTICDPESGADKQVLVSADQGEQLEALKAEIAEQKLQVLGDPQRLQQVVANLLTNAIKFTPEEGKVEVRLSIKNKRQETAPTGDENAHCPLPVVLIQVIDTGIGISAEFLPHVFERFRQADSTTTRSHGGLGLGLAIVRHLVELSNGRVAAHSLGEGQGSTFSVELPLLQNSNEAQDDNKLTPSLLLHPSTLALQGLRVLVVDDELDTRNFLTFALEQYGAEVIAVASASEAIAALQTSQPNILVSDIGMPEEDGYSLIRKIRTLETQTGVTMPAIALTAYSREEDCRQALDAGFHMHLAKPIEPTALITGLLNLIATTAVPNHYTVPLS